jgi:LPXTG-motif cell wall-anchored protein
MAALCNRGKSGRIPALTRNRNQDARHAFCEPGYPLRSSSMYTVVVYGMGALDPVGLSNSFPRHEQEGHPMRWVLAFLLAAVLACVGASPASANTADSASWLVHQVNGQGFIPKAADPSHANMSLTTQAIIALASTHSHEQTAHALMAYVDAHVDDYLVNGGVDDPGALSYVILARAAMGESVNALITRLQATQQLSGPNVGLFGAADATFDGAFRQGLSLLALSVVGVSNASGIAWLEGQQCPNGFWPSLRTDPVKSCQVDTADFTGPDTNSTAVAAIGLFRQGASSFATAAITALHSVRNSDGGFGFLATSGQPTDSNSTGLVMEAERTISGTADPQGTSALEALTVGCNGDPADVGGVAFEPGAGDKLVPNTFATVQALPAIAGASLPLVDVTFGAPGTSACTTSVSSTTTTTVPESSAGSSATTTTTVPAVVAAELPRTGSSATPLAVMGAVCILAGGVVVGGARRRRA